MELHELKITMAETRKDVQQIREILADNKSEHQELKLMIKDFINSAETKYAPVWVESAVKYVIAVSATAIIGAIFAVIIR